MRDTLLSKSLRHLTSGSHLEMAVPFKAMQALGVSESLTARWLARRTIRRAQHCDRCRRMLAHVFDRIGSTLFLEDDPNALVQSFDREERDPFSSKVLAAWIVLHGRPRVMPAL